MFNDMSDRETARRLVGLLREARRLARRFHASVCVIVYDTEFTIKILPIIKDELLLPSNAAVVFAGMDDEALSVCAVQITSARSAVHTISRALGSYQTFAHVADVTKVS